MSTITVPLNAEQIEHLDALVVEYGSSRAGVMRKALVRLAEEEAVNAILQSQREIAEGKILHGDLRKILMDS